MGNVAMTERITEGMVEERVAAILFSPRRMNRTLEGARRT